MRYLYNDYGLTANDAIEFLSVTISSRGQILFPTNWVRLYKLLFHSQASVSEGLHSIRNIEGPHFVDPREKSMIAVTSHMFVKRPH
ncbi:hypothetical protein AMTRI_Chr04g252100 [Amborella trichopoda]